MHRLGRAVPEDLVAPICQLIRLRTADAPRSHADAVCSVGRGQDIAARAGGRHRNENVAGPSVRFDLPRERFLAAVVVEDDGQREWFAVQATA